MSILYTLLYLIISIAFSIFAGYLTLHLIKTLLNGQYLLFGMGIFFLGIGLHSLIALPAAIFMHGFKILFYEVHNSGPHYQIWELLYYAVAAGIGQELSKGIPLWMELRRTENQTPEPPLFRLGINIGLGFSLSEIILIAITDWQPVMTDLNFFNLFWASLERFSATLFHMATAGLIAYGIEKNKTKSFLTLCILLHTTINFSAGILNEYPLLSTPSTELFLFIFSLLVLISSLLLTRKNVGSALLEKE